MMKNGMWLLAAVGLVAASCWAAPARAETATMLSKATPEQQAMFAADKKEALREAGEKYKPLAESEEGYFWNNSAKLVPLMEAYRYSHDPALVEAFVPLMEKILKDRYIHPTKPEWNGWYDYKGSGHETEIDEDSIVYFVPALMFAKEVRADPKLLDKYGKKAEGWLKDVEASIRNWDKRGCWHDLGDRGGWYTMMSGSPDPKTGEMTPLGPETARGANGTVPYNKVHALFQALSLAWQITGDPWYTTRMEKCATYFRAHWRMDDKHAEWNYRDLGFPGDWESGMVGQGKSLTGAFVHYKGGYYALDVAGVVWAWDAGVTVFSKKDLEKLLQTNLEFMFLGDAKDPKFKMINGNYKESEKYYKGMLWTALGHFDQRARDLWLAEITRDHGKTSAWLWWDDEVQYLIETSQPISWAARNAKAGVNSKAN